MATTGPDRSRHATFWVTLLAIYLFFLPLLLIYLLLAVWPDISVVENGKTTWQPGLNLFFYSVAFLPAETRLLLIVVFAGALGSFVHAATSFATYLGNRSLKTS